MSALETWVSKCLQQGHVDLELFQSALDGDGRPHRTNEVWVGEDFGEPIAVLPQLLYLEQGKQTSIRKAKTIR